MKELKDKNTIENSELNTENDVSSSAKAEEDIVVDGNSEEKSTQEELDAIMRKYDKESNTRIWTGIPNVIIKVLMAAFAIYCICMTLFSTALPEVKLPLFIAFIIVVGFLNYPANKHHVTANRMPWYDIVLMVVGAGCFAYFAIDAMTLIELSTRITWYQIVIAFVGIGVLVELCRRCVGIPIICVAGVLIIYAFANQMQYGLTLAIRQIAYKLFYTTSGVIGTPINVCYTYIVLFIIFGSFLERTGIANFFIALANKLAGWSSGGPAKVAVISSALCGMVSGSSVGNTVTTGSITIPMMKKTGYKPEFAGAVEAAASTGGQIMPPIMGAAAFLMAEYMNVPYMKVAVMAILPAVLYFAGIFIAVHLEAKKLGLKGIPKEELPSWGYLLKNCYLLIPLVLLVWLVASGTRTMSYSAAISILAAIVVGFVNMFLTNYKEHKEEGFGAVLVMTLKQSWEAIKESLIAGAKGSVTVGVACAMAGIIAGCITVTGLASILINGIVSIAGNATFIGLILTMLCCIVLGMGVPTTANYCIMASTCAPILISLGFEPVAAHFFVFYFGIVADITPPVALAAYAGSAIAKANPMKTGINATKLAIAAFIIPFIFAYSPELILYNVDKWYEVVTISITAILGLFSVAAALNGHLFKQIPIVLRIILAAGGLCMIIPGTLTDVIGFVVLAGVIVFQYFTKISLIIKKIIMKIKKWFTAKNA